MAKLETIIKPDMIKWARKRLNLSVDEFAEKMKVLPQRVSDWESGKTAITMKQAEDMASLSLLPLGLFFLNTPPKIDLKLPDFRSVGNAFVSDASPELEATILAMQEKQAWYKDFLIENGERPLSFIGSITPQTPIKDAAQNIKDLLSLTKADWESIKSWTVYMDVLIHQIESAGILFIRNGVVGNNTSRSLDPEEFRGFVLIDQYAPLIFINGKDSKNAQLFTLIHELVHLFLGESGLINASMNSTSANVIERYCNHVAAEFLVPEDLFRESFRKQDLSVPEMVISELAKQFKVSKFVVIARCRELSLFNRLITDSLWAQEAELLKKQKEKQKKYSGGDYFASLKYRVGQLFAQTIISEVLDRKISYSDAYHLLNIRNDRDLQQLSLAVGVPYQ